MSFKYCSKFHAFLSNSFFISSEFVGALTLIILFSIRYFMPNRKSSSDICPADHHPALFLIQDGITSEEFSLLFLRAYTNNFIFYKIFNTSYKVIITYLIFSPPPCIIFNPVWYCPFFNLL